MARMVFILKRPKIIRRPLMENKRFKGSSLFIVVETFFCFFFAFDEANTFDTKDACKYAFGPC